MVAVGGTFDRFHKGHEAVLDEAFRMGESVLIGISSDGFARKIKTHPVESFGERLRSLRNFLKKKGWMRNAKIVPIDDPYGPALTSRVLEAIVVSEETKQSAIELNRLREMSGLRPLKIIDVETVLAENGLPITTTRIREGKIDREGRIIKKG